MKVFWTPEAQQDREEIWNFILLDNPRAAIQIDELLSNAASRLSEHPLLGKPGKITGTRELIPHDSYRVVYEIEADTVWILAVVHTARLWPLRRN